MLFLSRTTVPVSIGAGSDGGPVGFTVVGCSGSVGTTGISGSVDGSVGAVLGSVGLTLGVVGLTLGLVGLMLGLVGVVEVDSCVGATGWVVGSGGFVELVGSAGVVSVGPPKSSAS